SRSMARTGRQRAPACRGRRRMSAETRPPRLSGRREVAVLLPYALPGPYSYIADEDVGDGDYVLAPLGPRNVIGVVWGAGSGDVDPAKLRRLAGKLDAPAMPLVHRRFVDWVA